nr:S8 family peptidase [Coralloluteibacterium stylophorae]
MLVPNDNYYQQYQWHLHDAIGGIGAESAWETSTGEGVVVAVLDTGITAHPDMDANMLEGYDFITDAFVSRRDSDERVPGAADLGDWNPVANECYAGSPVTDSSWHGTHTAGTVAELTDNATGMAGVAHDAKVLPVRVLGRCGGYTSDIADAIVWASGGEVDGVPTNASPAEVINMSLGGGGACDTLTQDAINGAVSRGTVVVVAAGNQGQDAANHSPASCANVINVGATGITGIKAYYSNYGNLVDLSAPGGGVTDGNPDGYVWQAINSGATVPEDPTYGGMAGTSMAAPHVAGIVALIQSAVEVPKTPAEIEAILKESARAFASAPSQPMGAGIVDAPAALALALDGGGEEPCEPGEPGCEEEPPIDSTPITSGQVVTGLSGVAGTEGLYRIEVPAGMRNLNVLTYGGTGDVSVYVSRGSEPGADEHDWASTRPGTNETVRVANPEAGVYYVKVVGESLYARVNLQARYN